MVLEVFAQEKQRKIAVAREAGGVTRQALLVPIDDLYLAPAAVTGVPADFDYASLIREVYDVQVVFDHANRPAVTVADAFRIRDARMRAEVELRAGIHTHQPVEKR